MEKYWVVIRNTWNEMTTYRLSFVMWRIRVFLQLLTVYFIWASVMPTDSTLFGYSRELMLTYVLGTQLINSIVFSSRTQEIAENINSGDLSIFLLKPLGYFKYWFARDLSDKTMNLAFSVVELVIFFLILSPPLFVQTNMMLLSLFVFSIFLAVLLNFVIGCLMSMIGFWSSEVWAPRFVFYVIISFFTGGLFPLDILPKPLFNFLELLPFTYLQFFPLKIYLGQVGVADIFKGLMISGVWIGILYTGLYVVWNKGLTKFSAAGR